MQKCDIDVANSLDKKGKLKKQTKKKKPQREAFKTNPRQKAWTKKQLPLTTNKNFATHVLPAQ